MGSIYANWERGDYRSTEWAHPQLEFVIADLPDQDTSRGVGIHDGKVVRLVIYFDRDRAFADLEVRE